MANVLIVDDDVDGCRPLVRLLQYVGHSPFFVHDGRAALSMLDQLRPDMILLDVMMPGCDGIEVLKTIRAHPVHKDLPVVVYNIPGRTGSTIQPETIARMAGQCPTVVAVKEATGSLDIASQVAALCDVTILSGDDSLTLPLMSIGGKGVVSVVGNVVPRDMMALVKAFAAGKFEDALKWHRKLFPLCRDMLGVATNPIPVKTAMKLLGRGNGEMRLPMCPMDAAGEAKVRQTLVNYGLLKG